MPAFNFQRNFLTVFVCLLAREFVLWFIWKHVNLSPKMKINAELSIHWKTDDTPIKIQKYLIENLVVLEQNHLSFNICRYKANKFRWRKNHLVNLMLSKGMTIAYWAGLKKTLSAIVKCLKENTKVCLCRRIFWFIVFFV